MRLGHRLHRDFRITTHCALVARALGASAMIIAGDRDDDIIKGIQRVNRAWGGDFQIEYRKVPSGLPAMLEDTVAGIRALSGQVDFWWESAGPLGEVSEYTKALLDHSSIPIVVGHKMDSVKMGALACINASFEANGRETAMLVDAILKGTDPGDIPAIPPTSFNLGINITTALKIDVVVPPDIMELAGKHIYK